jgi:hypothetical protein
MQIILFKMKPTSYRKDCSLNSNKPISLGNGKETLHILFLICNKFKKTLSKYSKRNLPLKKYKIRPNATTLKTTKRKCSLNYLMKLEAVRNKKRARTF